MQPSTRDQIIKLLDISAMIEDYIASSQRKPQPLARGTYSKPKAAPCKHSPLNTTGQDPVGKHSQARSQSVRSIAKKAADVVFGLPNKDHLLNKTYSTKLSKHTHQSRFLREKTKSHLKPHVKPPTKLFVTQQNDFNQADDLCHTIPCENLNSTHETALGSDQRKFFNRTYQTLKPGNSANQTSKPSVNRLSCKSKTKSRLLRGRYQLERAIGNGLSGQVYKARDILCDRWVAVKIIEPSNTEHDFIKELSHPNLISYYNSFLENSKRYIILEYLPKSLSEVARKRKLTSQQLRHVFKSVASGLMYLHSLSYAHRDIKLDNIVASQDLRTVKFIDFGLCIDTSESSANKLRQFCGTTSYMAPEVISGECKSPKKADIWSLGVVLYSLSVGRAPFTGRQESQIFKKIQTSKLLFPPEIQELLRDLLSGMLNKDPAMRLSIFQVINHPWLGE